MCPLRSHTLREVFIKVYSELTLECSHRFQKPIVSFCGMDVHCRACDKCPLLRLTITGACLWPTDGSCHSSVELFKNDLDTGVTWRPLTASRTREPYLNDLCEKHASTPAMQTVLHTRTAFPQVIPSCQTTNNGDRTDAHDHNLDDLLHAPHQSSHRCILRVGRCTTRRRGGRGRVSGRHRCSEVKGLPIADSCA